MKTIPTAINTYISNGLVKYMEKMPVYPSANQDMITNGRCWAKYESSLQAAIESAPEFENQEEIQKLLPESAFEITLMRERIVKDGHYPISVDREVQVVRQFRYLAGEGIEGKRWKDCNKEIDSALRISEYRFIARLVEKKENECKA